MKVIHMTTVHKRNDIRIFIKQCSALSSFGHDVALLIADGLGDDTVKNIKIYDVGKKAGRLKRMLLSTIAMYQKAIELNAEVYHFHDAELLPVGYLLKKKGKEVVYDVHEDLPKQVYGKPYLKPYLKPLISKGIKFVEDFVSRRLSSIVGATPVISERFNSLNQNVININNFPILGELAGEVEWEEKSLEVCYVGGITEIRGIHQVVEAFGSIGNCRLNLVGEFGSQHLRNELKDSVGWNNINELGFLNREGVRDILSRSIGGLVTFLPLPNHVDAQPNKMFEYMSAGVPVIASNFPLWKDVIEKNECGICVDPESPAEISKAIQYLANNPIKARQMGENGKKAVASIYNWGIESLKLKALYESFEGGK